jgi:hypothetical protein
MNKMRTRAQAQFPIVLLTLISIIQALALELMWSKITESDFLFSLEFSAIVTWGMISVTLMGILQIWVMYSTLVIGFTWRPSLRDSILPFVIGIQEFMMISLISEEFNVLWLYVLASIFIMVNWVVQITFRRARAEPENEQFFRGRSPATWKDFRGAFTIIFLLIIFGMLITAVANSDWLALIAIIFANIALAIQIWNSRRLWRTIMNLEDE